MKKSISIFVVGLILGGLVGATTYQNEGVWGAASIVQDQFVAISDAQREEFNIQMAAWVPAGSGLPARTFILGCHGCAGVQYGPTGAISNAADLNKIPTSYVVQVPETWNQKLVAMVPSSGFDHTLAGSPILQGIAAGLLIQGYGVSVMNHPSPGFTDSGLPGPSLFPFSTSVDSSYSTKDLRNGYLGTSSLIKDLVSSVFSSPLGTYGLGWSRGDFSGLGLLTAENGAPFDGYVLASGGNGRLQTIQSFIQSITTLSNQIPLTKLPHVLAGFPAPVVQVIGAELIGIADPEFRLSVLGGLASFLSYDVTTRPKDVQKAWEELELGADLTKPTIVIHGLHDRLVFPDDAISFVDRVVSAGKDSLLRTFFFKNMGHSPVDVRTPLPVTFIDAVNKLDAWVQTATEPAPVNGGPYGPRASCTSLGFGSNALGCFCEAMGGVTFPDSIGGVQPIPECAL